MEYKKVVVGGGVVEQVEMANNLPFVLIAGPCQLQTRDIAIKTCEHLMKVTEKLGIKYIFKGSFDKANRNSVSAARGIGLDEGIKIFDEIRNTYRVPVMTDVHTEEQAAVIAPHVDMIQQPAFLIRQTDLSKSIAEAGKVCNLKKAQFMAPKDMKNVIKKFETFGNTKLCLTERGTSFGYGALVVDNPGIITMAETGYPVIMDATHSVQRPAAEGDHSGGEARMAPIVARAALSTGFISAVYIETHPEPLKGGSDTTNMIPLMYMEEVLEQLKAIDDIAKANLPRLEDWHQEGKVI